MRISDWSSDVCSSDLRAVNKSNGAQSQRCPRQYRSQRAANPSRIMAQDISPDFGEVQNGAVRLPLAPPVERQRIASPFTKTCPVERFPIGCPTKLAR